MELWINVTCLNLTSIPDSGYEGCVLWCPERTKYPTPGLDVRFWRTDYPGSIANIIFVPCNGTMILAYRNLLFPFREPPMNELKPRVARVTVVTTRNPGLIYFAPSAQTQFYRPEVTGEFDLKATRRPGYRGDWTRPLRVPKACHRRREFTVGAVGRAAACLQTHPCFRSPPVTAC